MTRTSPTSLNGNYSVTVRQEIRGKAVTLTVRGAFAETESGIQGSFEYSPTSTGAELKSALSELDLYQIKCDGFRRGTLVQLHFDNTLDHVHHFGACMVAAEKSGAWSGQWVGYSPENQGIITGDISLIPVA